MIGPEEVLEVLGGGWRFGRRGRRGGRGRGRGGRRASGGCGVPTFTMRDEGCGKYLN